MLVDPITAASAREDTDPPRIPSPKTDTACAPKMEPVTLRRSVTYAEQSELMALPTHTGPLVERLDPIDPQPPTDTCKLTNARDPAEIVPPSSAREPIDADPPILPLLWEDRSPPTRTNDRTET